MRCAGTLLLALAAVVAVACGSDSGGEGMGDAGMAPDAVPGSPRDGGDDVSAGGVDASIPPGCLPTTCEEQGVLCGTTSDGCGNTLMCGTCGATSCFSGQCTESMSCGDQDPNDCFSCGALVATPGTSCGCGTLSATCNLWGTVSCYDGNSELEPASLPATDDAQTVFAEISGSLESVVGDPHDIDDDRFDVVVSDVPADPLAPRLELDHANSGTLVVRLEYVPDDDQIDPLPLVECSSSGQMGSQLGGCETTVAPGSGTLAIAGTVFFDGDAPADTSGTWRLRVAQRRVEGESLANCDTYTLRYRF